MKDTKGKVKDYKNANGTSIIMICPPPYEDNFLLATINDFDGSNPEANARRICLTHNNFDELVELVKEMLPTVKNTIFCSARAKKAQNLLSRIEKETNEPS